MYLHVVESFICMRCGSRKKLIVCSIFLFQSSSKPDTSPDNSTSLHRKLNDDGYWIGPLLGIIPACILGCLVMALIFLDKKSKITYGLTYIQLILYFKCRKQVILIVFVRLCECHQICVHDWKILHTQNICSQNITHLYRILLFMW